ncbi:MAG: GAF domain-containing protein [Kouleothrix sp.]|nr:GAF domain-containing protein [Kouleothrix sp.]
MNGNRNATDHVELLQRRLDEETRRAESLRRVIESISGELALQPLLTRIIQCAVELIGADDGVIGLVIERWDGPVVRAVASFNMPQLALGQEIGPGVGLSGMVLQERRPIRLNSYSDLSQPALPEPDDYAVIGMPIWWAGQMIGFFGIGAAPPRRLDEEDVATLELFARHAAIAIENARRYEQERRRTEQLALVARIGRTLTADLPLNELLQSAADAIHELLGYENIGIPLIDPADPTMMALRAFGGGYRSAVGGEHYLPVSAGIMGAAVQTRQVQLVNDVAADPRYILPPGAADIRAELAVPILSGDQVLGVLNAESSERFSAQDAATLQIVADQLAAPIVNARLFAAERRRTARIAAINRIGRLITSSLSLPEILQTAVEAIAGQLHLAHVAADLIDPANPEVLVLLAQAGAGAARVPIDYRQSIHAGIIGAAVRARQRMLVNNVAADPRYLAALGSSAIRAELVVPISIGDRLMGVLNIESERPISHEDAAGVEIIADQLAVAIENARLFADTQAALDATRLLYETSRRTSIAMSLEAVVAAYLEQVAARGRYACSVVLHEADDAGQWVGATIHGVWSPQAGLNLTETRAPYTAQAFTPAIDAGQTITIADVTADPLVSAALREQLLASGNAAITLIPLMVRGQRIGLVSLVAAQPHAWSEAELQPYQITAALLAAAIESRRQHLLLAERGQQLAVLEERRRLARELHDSVTQSLFSMSLLAQVLPELWEVDQPEARTGLQQIRDLTRTALAEMRALLVELRPAALADRGLAHALREHVTAFEQRTGLSVALEVAGDCPLPAPVEQAFFRIAQEALANVARHAQARRVRVTLRGQAPVRLQIADDGRGFRPGQVGDGRFGLLSMRERAAAAGAWLQVRSAAGQGTEIVVEWPAPDQGEQLAIGELTG